MRLDAGNTAIVLDSTADFPQALERFPSWRIVPLSVSFGDQSYRDYVDLAPGEFYARLRDGAATPTTSQPSPGDFMAAYEELAGYERILSLHIASTLSGTFDSARRAGEELGGGRVRAIDTGAASAAIAILALAIQRRLERGTSDEEIDELVARFRRERGLLFTVDTLDYLARGGRIGRARAAAGDLLHVRPILAIEDGEVVPVRRVRGSRRALAEFARELEERTTDGPELRLGIAHAAAPERLAELRELVRRVRPQASIEVETELGPVLGAHAGPGTIGFFWFRDE